MNERQNERLHFNKIDILFVQNTLQMLALLGPPLLAMGNNSVVVGTRAQLPPPPPLQMHWLGGETEARCMDGSRFGYYFRPASSTTGSTKWVIELQGGGWCYNEGACYGRTLLTWQIPSLTCRPIMG